MAKRIPLAEAKARFSAIVDEVFHDSEHYVVERRGRPVAAIVRVEELERIEASNARTRRPAGALALVGALGDLDDSAIDAVIRDIFAAREQDSGRSVIIES